MTKSSHVALAFSTLSLLGAAVVACEDDTALPSGGSFDLPESATLNLDGGSSPATNADGTPVTVDGSVIDGSASPTIRDASASDAASNDAFLPLPGDRGGAVLPLAPANAGANDVLLALFAMPA